MINYIYNKFLLHIVDKIKNADNMTVYKDLLRTEYMSRADLESIQFDRLKKLVVHAYEHVPYYHDVFENAGFSPYDFSHPDQLNVLPLLDKQTIRDNYDRLQADNEAQYAPRGKSTSGSTGQPLVYQSSRLAHSCGWPNVWLAFSVVGFEVGDSFVILAGGALLPRSTTFTHKVYTRLMRIKQLPVYHMSEEEFGEYVDTLKMFKKPFIMYAYANAAYHFALYVRRHGITGIPVKGVFTTSEVLGPHQRAAIEECLGCPVYDTYGNPESALFAFECQEQSGLHYDMLHSYTEILNDNNEPVPNGEHGHIISTNLANYVMPFIRYNTGDLGILSTEKYCCCGRGYHKLSNIIGRTRDVIYTPDGRKIHGAFFNHFEPFYTIPWIAGWHVLQDRIDHLTITIKPQGDPIVSDIEKMTQLLKKGLHNSMVIDFRFDDKLQTTSAAKLKLIECKLDPVENKQNYQRMRIYA